MGARRAYIDGYLLQNTTMITYTMIVNTMTTTATATTTRRGDQTTTARQTQEHILQTLGLKLHIANVIRISRNSPG